MCYTPKKDRENFLSLSNKDMRGSKYVFTIKKCGIEIFIEPFQI